MSTSYETATYIGDIADPATIPADSGTNGKRANGAAEMRKIKDILTDTLPNLTGQVTSTHTELNILDGVTSTAAELNILDGVTSTAAELNVLDGVTAFVDEDDMASDSATSIASQQSIKKYVDDTDTAARAYTDAHGTVQVVNTITGASSTGANQIPADDTIPQQTEGIQFMTLAITPTSATNALKIDVVVHCSHSGTNESLCAALFQDATADALACSWAFSAVASEQALITFTHYMTAGTTGATTFKVRVGAASAGTTTFNGWSGGRRYGGVLASSITITEYKV